MRNLLPGVFCVTLLTGSPVYSQAQPGTVVAEAIRAAGAESALRAFPVLAWDGEAAIHLPERVIRIAGRWLVRPPDTALVETWLADADSTSARTLVLAGMRGWTRRAGAEFTPMTEDFLRTERHQFYLYSLMRIVPLADHHLSVEVISPAPGPPILLVRHPGRPDVRMVFDSARHLVRLETVFAAPDTAVPDSQEIWLTGLAEARGVRWFERMEIRRNGAPWFELRIRNFRVFDRLDDPRIARLTSQPSEPPR